MTQERKHSKNAAGLARNRFLAFSVAGARYAFPVYRVSEVLSPGDVPLPLGGNLLQTPLGSPGEPGIPVYALRGEQDESRRNHTENTSVISLETGNGNVGVIVDFVHGIVEIHPETIKTTEGDERDVSPFFVTGIANNGGEDMTLLELPSSDEFLAK